ncbi:hypothetical protein [Actinomadura oligospora]|uniref:hypothetical protein n=1 Tax=Actinomadura oligospora TaxID=111804 RepID=UPI00047ACFB0|nr:hypothetical protein [Actinomadura oligospora]
MSELDLAARLDELVRESNADGSGESPAALARLLFELPDEAGTADVALKALQDASPRTWVKLDEHLRLCSFHRPGSFARRRRAAAKAKVSSPLGVLRALCSPDGRVREAALQRSAELPRLLPVVVIRAADWAAPVRDAARAVLPELLRDALRVPGARAVTSVATATHLAGRRRGDFVVELAADLLVDVSPDVLLAVRNADGRHVRRLACRVWLSRPDTDVRDVLDAVLGEADNVCRLWCARHLVERALAEQRSDLVEPLLSAVGGDLRAMALDALVRLGRSEVGRAFLGDRSAGVRAVAQWAVRRDGEDPVPFYREALAACVDDGTAAVAGVLLGLGECGSRDDAVLAVPFLRHGRPRVRAAAIRAASGLGGREGGWAALLTDSAPVVVRMVSRTMIALEVTVPVGELWALLDPARPRHVRRAAYLLLRHRDTWTRLEADLRLLAGRDAELGERARADLLRWVREAVNAYARLPVGGREVLEELLRDVRDVLPDEVVRRLRWQLGH